MFWYNCVYTPLKRTTGFAVLAGALAGALPPLIGYSAAGGHVTDGFIVVCVFMYLWQVSHFLLLLFKFRNEYQRAGIPTIAFTMNEDRFKVTFFIWILGTAGSTLLMPLFHIIASVVLLPMLIIGNSLFVFYFYIAVFRGKKEFNACPRVPVYVFVPGVCAGAADSGSAFQCSAPSLVHMHLFHDLGDDVLHRDPEMRFLFIDRDFNDV